MQIKVNNIKIHTLDGGKLLWDKPVAEGKLVLIPNTDIRTFPMLNKPLIISETEKIEEGDWYINGNIKANNHKIAQCQSQAEADSLNKIKQLMETPEFPKQVITAKILVLPEHFSPSQLQMIVDGKLKDGDKVLVECERVERDQENWYWATESVTLIKFDAQSHVTLYPVEEKIYTRAEIGIFLDKLKRDIISKFGCDYFYFKNEWFEENIK